MSLFEVCAIYVLKWCQEKKGVQRDRSESHYTKKKKRSVLFLNNILWIRKCFRNKITFSGEAHFHLDGLVNRQNCFQWDSRVIVEKEMRPQRVTVWNGVWVRGIIGPFFFFENAARPLQSSFMCNNCKMWILNKKKIQFLILNLCFLLKFLLAWILLHPTFTSQIICEASIKQIMVTMLLKFWKKCN